MALLNLPVDEEELAALEDDYGNSNWGTDDEGSLGGAQFISAEEQAAIDDTIDMLSAQMKKFRIRGPAYLLLILRDLAGAKCILQVPATACWHIRAKVKKIYHTKSAKKLRLKRKEVEKIGLKVSFLSSPCQSCSYVPTGGRQLASIAAFLRSPSTILIDMACLRTIRTSDPSTDHQFLVGSIEVRLMHGIATSRSAAKSAKVKTSSQRCST
ncbi:hypothetical protein J1614_010795 [Plenodomus biglobosus]|nr:hypothetical protein J1614_010795 [Plenodomus biglobosus]